MGGTFSGVRTTLVFDGAERLVLEALAVSASFEWRASERVTLAAGAGGVVAGRLRGAGEDFDFLGGLVASLSGSALLFDQDGARPFLMLAGAVSFSGVRAAPTAYVALDLRASLVAGYTLFERFTPYAVARGFGGPVFWRGQVGTDLFHYQLGAGAVVGLPLGLDLSLEVVPLGEQRFTAGFGSSF